MLQKKTLYTIIQAARGIKRQTLFLMHPVLAGIAHSRSWSSVYANPSTAERLADRVVYRCPQCQTWCFFGSFWPD